MSEFFTSLTKDELRGMFREEINLAKFNDAQEEAKLKTKDEFLTVAEACQLLKISKPTLYARIADGTITAKHMGNRVLFVRAELLNAVNKGGK